MYKPIRLYISKDLFGGPIHEAGGRDLYTVGGLYTRGWGGLYTDKKIVRKLMGLYT